MKLIEIAPLGNFTLFVRYDDGSNGVVDLSDFAGRGVFHAWSEPGVFQQAKLAEAGYPEWPGEIDLCPDALYLRLTDKRPEEVFPNLNRLHANA